MDSLQTLAQRLDEARDLLTALREDRDAVEAARHDVMNDATPDDLDTLQYADEAATKAARRVELQEQIVQRAEDALTTATAEEARTKARQLEADAYARYGAALTKALAAVAVAQEADQEITDAASDIRHARRALGNKIAFTPIRAPHVPPQWRGIAEQEAARYQSQEGS